MSLPCFVRNLFLLQNIGEDLAILAYTTLLKGSLRAAFFLSVVCLKTTFFSEISRILEAGLARLVCSVLFTIVVGVYNENAEFLGSTKWV